MIDIFEYLARAVALWQDSTIKAAEENDMTAFLQITAATINELYPFFMIKCSLSVSDAEDKYHDVIVFRTVMNDSFYALMAAINEDQATASIKQIERKLRHSPVISLSGRK